MILDIRAIENGSSIHFDDAYDLTDLDFFGEQPIAEPLRFTGDVSRRADLVSLEGELSTRLHLRCDRCGVRYEHDRSIAVSVLLTHSLQNEERDDIVVCPSGSCDLEQIAVPEWVLSMDYQNLCREDCEGLCVTCGANRNAGDCRCED